MSSATDPYQPIETELQITRGILKIFADLPPNQQPFLHIITRSPYVTRDIDLLQRLHRKIITLSFPTDDDEVRKALEPHAPSIPTRWQTLEKLAAANIPTSINFCPIIRINFPKETAQKIKTLQVKRVLWDVPHNRPNTNNGFVGTTPNNGWETLKKIGWTEEESILAQTRLSTALKEAKAP
jgi:DNA repair photolyase